ncbi:uncharacterized protein [Argopecten irradians]|uniref:uncharacterized protein n=1 Tax=Argopecten irradians TaxID=31199 RepID=UPI00371C4218
MSSSNNKPEKMVLIDKSSDDSDQHKSKLHDNKCFQGNLLLIVFVLDMADLFADWLLFRDVYTIKEGLVYGPPPETLTYALLTFSVVGTVTFTFEVVNLVKEVCHRRPWINPDLVSAICIWAEDIPQLVVSLRIMICREEAISYFQLVKAVVIMIGVIIRIIFCLVLYCNVESLLDIKKPSWDGCLKVTYRFLIMLGLLLVFCCSVALFFFTQFERKDDGGIQFTVPKSMFEGKYDEERYFQNVSMYLHHPLINFDDGSLPHRENVGWIRLISIYDVREKGEEIFKIDFDEETKTKMIIWQSNSNNTLQLKECYTIDRKAKSLTSVTNCDQDFIPEPKMSMVFKFVFEEKEIPTLIFGDIKFNCKVERNRVCLTPLITFVTRVSEYSPSVTQQHAIIHYYRTKSDVPQNSHLLKTGLGNEARFYRNDLDLIDIATVWKTGFGSCESTGSLAPHISTDLQVQCDV